MASGAKTAVVGIGALFIGALVGGVVGAAFGRPVLDGLSGGEAPSTVGAAETGAGVAARPGGPADGAELLRALGALTEEVRGMRTDLEARSGERTAPGGGTPELERLAELLDVLATNLKNSARPGTAPGYQGAPLLLPPGEPHRNRLADLGDLPEDERGKANRFLTYQQVLDRFGAPDHVTRDGIWLYVDPLSDVEIQFHFKDGLVTNVY